MFGSVMRRLRARRRSVVAGVVGSALAGLTVVGGIVGATPANAALGTFVAGTWSCPGSTAVAHAPTMTSLYNDTENVLWEPVVQKWVNGTGWVNYKWYASFNGVATPRGSSYWTNANGWSADTWTATVQPGSYYNGVYYPTYYRVVNYYRWLDINNNPLTSWRGYVISGPYAYCSY